MRYVIITGGTRGIGKALTEQCRQDGWRVSAPGQGECDMRDPASIRAYVGTIPMEHVTAVILNAHRWYSAPMQDQRWDDFSAQMAYVIGHWYLLQHVLRESPVVRTVVGVASTRGLIGGVETAPYSMAKAAMIAMMQGFQREYHQGITFHCVCPGWTDTDMGAEVRATGGASAGAVPQSPGCVAAVIRGLLQEETPTGIWRINAGKVEQMQWGVV